MPQIGIISTFGSGVDLVFEWNIEKIFSLPESVFWSPTFFFGDGRWYLMIFPNGSRGNDSSGHLDLYLSKYPSDRSIKQSFSLSLKTAKGEKYNEQHLSKDFENYGGTHHNRFINRSELCRRRSDLAPDGTLTVICTMKSSTSAGSASTTRLVIFRPPRLNISCLDQVTTGNHHEHAYVGASTQRLGAATQRLGASTQRLGASTQHLGASTQRLGASTQRLGASTQRVAASTQTVETFTQTEEEKYEAIASGSSTNSQEMKALHDFKELFLKKEDCDVTIKVKSSEFPAHRVILKARSPVLASTFRHDMKESATGVLEIDDCDPSSFSDFLCFLYCADVQLITQKSVFNLFTLADKYQVLDLRSKCLEFMKMNLTVDTFCETITLALRHSETDLIKLSTDYFTKNAPKIIVTVKWQTFLAENPTESNELFIKLLVPNNS